MKINAVFVSCTDGYPTHFNAGNTKCSMVARGLIKEGDDVLFINKLYGPNNKVDSGVDQYGIEFLTLGNNGSRFGSFLRNIKRCIAVIKRKYSCDANNQIFVGCSNFFVYLPIIIAAKIKGYKVAYIFEEWMLAMKFPFVYKVNAFLMSYCIGFLCDSILPISEFLTEKARLFKKPMFKLPICADFNNVSIEGGGQGDYFLYCASAAYTEVLDFVLDSFKNIYCICNNFRLRLVLSGSTEELNNVSNKIKERGLSNSCTLETKLPYETLLNYYSNAMGLLIPLNPMKLTDVARFSQKIAEYLSSKRPIISTSVGEIPIYFINRENMFIADYNLDSYSSMMKYVYEHHDEATNVGVNGFEFGCQNFDYRVLGQKLHDFLNTIV